MGSARERILSVQAFLSPGDLPNPGWNLGILHCRQIFLPLSHKCKSPWGNSYLLGLFIWLFSGLIDTKGNIFQCAMNYWNEIFLAGSTWFKPSLWAWVFFMLLPVSVYITVFWYCVCFNAKGKVPTCARCFPYIQRLRLVLTVWCCHGWAVVLIDIIELWPDIQIPLTKC